MLISAGIKNPTHRVYMFGITLKENLDRVELMLIGVLIALPVGLSLPAYMFVL